MTTRPRKSTARDAAACFLQDAEDVQRDDDDDGHAQQPKTDTFHFRSPVVGRGSKRRSVREWAASAPRSERTAIDMPATALLFVVAISQC
jgi:hypothetical protein